jgi:hypothetical protein
MVFRLAAGSEPSNADGGAVLSISAEDPREEQREAGMFRKILVTTAVAVVLGSWRLDDWSVSAELWKV